MQGSLPGCLDLTARSEVRTLSSTTPCGPRILSAGKLAADLGLGRRELCRLIRMIHRGVKTVYFESQITCGVTNVDGSFGHTALICLPGVKFGNDLK